MMSTSSMPAPIKEKPLAITPLILIAFSTAIIFIVDLMLPRGVAVPMLYVIPILLAVHCQQQWFRVSVAVGCTVLTLLGYMLTESAVPMWIAVSNRAMAVASIWVSAVLAWRHLQATEHISTLQDLLPMCASCKKIRDDKGYWSQVEQYIEAHTKTIFSHGICPECMLKWYPEFYPQVVEQYPDLFKDTSEKIADEHLRHGGRPR
jgi:hypothetical protein